MRYRALLRRVLTRSFLRARGAAPPLAIFLYHSVVQRALEIEEFCFIREEEFRLQLDALCRRFRLVSLEEGARLLAAGELREPTAVITFDDGFRDNFDVVYPLLIAARAPATIFVCTDLLDTTRAPWYCRLHDAITRTGRRRVDWDGRHYSLDGAAARTQTAKALKMGLKRLRQPELEATVDELVLGLVSPAPAGEISDSRFRILTRAAMREMASSGLVEFGAHTGSHAILSRLTRDEQRDEIERSIREVSSVTGKPCRLFAYPNGRFEDYDSTTIALLRDAGVTVAVTAEKGVNQAATSPLELLRHAIGGEPSLPMFDAVLRRFERASQLRS